VFCVDIEHAERMRQALINASPVESRRSSKYVMRITGDDNVGKRELDNFINPEEPYPVIAVTSKLMTTGVDAQTCKLIVLDSTINSMTEFKQIIGRGTRINEEYGKQFFTIMDFRNVTNLFADPDFDGDPVQIKTIQAGDDGEADYENEDEEREVFDPVSGKKIDFGQDIPDDIISGGEIYEKHGKVYVSGIDVSILNERAQYLDENGKLIVESLKEYTKRGILRNYRSMDEFLAKWNDADKKSVIIEELEKHGVFFENFMDDIQRDNSNLANVDIFDLICHIAWDKKPLSRAERAAQVKKRNCFAKYEEKARKVIDALLDKYASEGIVNIEELSILKVDPLNNFGTPQEIIGVFGGKENYLNAVHELEKEIYRSDNNREAA
jgi:type I restriction enzyme R subunit